MKADGRTFRIHERFMQRLRKAKAIRVVNGVDKKFRNDKELTGMMLNCPSFPSVEKELGTIPKKEDINKL